MAACPLTAVAQDAAAPTDALRPAADGLAVKADAASSWQDGQTNILLLRGDVTLVAGEATLRAQTAVVWLTKLVGESRTRVDVALLGGEADASIETPEARKLGRELAANFVLDGGVRLDVPARAARDESESPAYRQAVPLRPPPAATVPAGIETPDATQPATTTTAPATGPASTPAARVSPVQISAASLTTTPADDGRLAVVATGGVFLSQRTPEGDLIELRAERAVVYTKIARLDATLGALNPTQVSDVIGGAYLEGDVRATYTPGRGRRGDFASREQRLEARQLYYDFDTGRAVLTKAVLHTSEPLYGQPLTLRANLLRQLSVGNYEAKSAELSTSRFAVPDYSLNSGRVFVRTREDRAIFGADNVTARLFGVPVFYFPAVRGATLDNRLPIRQVSVGSSRNFGFGVQTEWGLFETLNATPPKTLDATYSLDYFAERGPAAGFDATYRGDLFLFQNRPENFNGRLELYGVKDHGDDQLGGARLLIPQDAYRGHAYYEHRHYFSDGVSAQLRAGYASDPTYLPEWNQRQFNEGLPHDLFFNLEQSRGNDLLAVGIDYDINNFPTVADELEEFAGVQRLPELRYARFGENLGPATLTSRNRLGALRFKTFSSSPADLGFVDRDRSQTVDEAFAGIPSYAYTGLNDDVIARGDFRQELALPLDIGPLKIVPFLVGRLTAYSQDATGDTAARLLGGVGARVGTALARTNNNVYSRLLDLDRIRHVVEPSVSLFASAQNRDRSEFLVFDPDVDGVSDVRAVQLALRQRFQTQRGAPGRRRSVDVLAVNVEANFFDNEPAEVAGQSTLGPVTAGNFRGLYFNGEPEASLPRDGLNADALWRVSDTTALVGDAAYNLTDDDLATVAAGVIVTRGDRLSYSLGGRYVAPLDLTLGVGSLNYTLSQRYNLSASASYDFQEYDIRNSTVYVTRKFDRFAFNVGLYLDRIQDEGGIRFSFYPLGFPGFSSDTLKRIGGV